MDYTSVIFMKLFEDKIIFFKQRYGFNASKATAQGYFALNAAWRC